MYFLPRYFSTFSRCTATTPGKADQLPTGLVAVAAVDRIGEHALHDGLIEHAPERAHRWAGVESDLGRGKSGQHLFALLLIDTVEGLAVGLAAIGVGRLDTGAVKLRGRQRQLVALVRRAALPRSLHIETVALAPAAGERPINVDVEADVGALRRQLIGRDHVVDQRLDESRLFEVEECIAGLRGRVGIGRGDRLRFCGRSARYGSGRRCSTADHRAFEKITPIEVLVAHDVLPSRLRLVSAGLRAC